MPVAVFSVGCGLGTETYSADTLLNMVLSLAAVAALPGSTVRKWPCQAVQSSVLPFQAGGRG